MSEINGKPVGVGDKIIVGGSLIAKLTMYDEVSNVMNYVIADGGGTNNFLVHINNTPFELFSLANSEVIVATQDEVLDEEVSNVNFIADPQMEPENTDRVHGGEDQFITGGSTTRNNA